MGEVVAGDLVARGVDQDVEVLAHRGIGLGREPLLEVGERVPERLLDALLEPRLEVEDLLVEAGDADLARALRAEAGDHLEEDLRVGVALRDPGGPRGRWARAGDGVKPAATNASVETANRDQGFMKGPRSRGRFESRNGARLYDRRGGTRGFQRVGCKPALDGQWTGKDDAGPLGQIRTSTKRTRGDMRTRASVFAATLLGAVTLTASLAAQEAAKTEEKKWSVNAPPGEAATVSIDTRTGTWMSVDVSPDGQRARLRPARRPLHAADRGRRGDAR